MAPSRKHVPKLNIPKRSSSRVKNRSVKAWESFLASTAVPVSSKRSYNNKKGKFGKFYGYFLKLSLPFIFILFCFCSPNETSIESNSTKIVVKSINNPYLPARKSSSNQKNWGGFLHQLKGSFNRSFKRTMTLQKNSNQPKSFVKNNVNLSSSEADSHHLVYSNSASKFISETFVENNAGWWCRAVYINILLLLFGPSV